MASSTHPLTPSSVGAARPRCGTPASQDGFSLIEVLVTALIVALLATAVSTALIAQTHSSGDQQLRSQANTLVNQDQDRLRGLSDQALSSLASNGSATSTQTAGNQSYTITSSASYQDSSGNSSCASGSVDYFKINSTASWTEAFAGGSTRTASADSLLARPVTGELQTVVKDQTGSALPGVSVSATPTGGSTASQSGLTDSTGCSVFAGLSAGPYTVTASKSGYVTPTNTTPASSSQSVTDTGSVASAPFTIGQAGSVTANFQAASPSAPGQADGLMYSGTGPGYQTVAGHGSTTTLPAAAQTAASLFPFESTANSPVYTNNYSLYAGQCSYQAPPPANLTSTTVTPGGAATATVREPLLDVASLTGAGWSFVPADIVLTYQSGSCTDSYTANVAAAASGTQFDYEYPPSTGWLASPGQPYAASASVLSVCADTYLSPTQASSVGYPSGYYSGTATTANSSFTSKNPSAAGLTINVTSFGQCAVQ